mgnify:CR=1 FL=1
MSWNKFNRRNQERASAKNNREKFPPWEMNQLTFVPDETFYARFLEPEQGVPYDKAYHWPQGGGPHACTLEHPDFDEKCVFCYYFSEKGDRGRRTVRTVLDVLDFRYWHIIDHPKREGKETIQRCAHDDPSPTKIRCAGCKSPAPRTSERHFGGHKVVELTGDQWDSVWMIHSKLQKTCIHQDEDGSLCEGKVYPISYLCANVECGHQMLSEEDIEGLDDVQLAHDINNLYTCESCGHEDYPAGVFICESKDGITGRTRTPAEEEAYGPNPTAGPEEGGHWAVRASMFDKALEVTIKGTAKRIGDNDVVLKSFNFSDSPDWSTAEDDLLNFGIEGEAAEKIIAPWDLSQRYRPERKVKREDCATGEEYVDAVLDSQAESISQKNPYPAVGKKGGFSGGGGRGGLRSFTTPK